MARVELLSFSDGVITTSLGQAVTGAVVKVYTHGTTTPVTVYAAEVGGGTLTQDNTFVTDNKGRIPGWVDETQRLDVLVQGVTTPLEAFSGTGTGTAGPPGVGANWRGIWAIGTTYAAGDGVTGSNGHNYISLTAGNIGHDPTTDGGVHWSDLIPSSTISASQVALGSMGATPSVNLGSIKNQLVMVTGTLNANAALTLSNLAAGNQIWLLLTQDGTGGRTLTVNGSSVTIPAAAGAQCVVECDFDGSTLFVSAPPAAAGASGDSIVDGFVAAARLESIVSQNVPGTNHVIANRITVPKSGHLRDLAVHVATQNGNYIAAVYDTGDALAGSRTKLWDSGSQAVGGPGAWRVIGDPNLAVVAGQQLDLAVMFDNSGGNASIAFWPGFGTAGPLHIGVLPTSFLPAAGGASPKIVWEYAPGSFAMPATVTEANCGVLASYAIAIIARVS